MILPFSTELHGKPTYFVEKIHKCFSLREIYMIAALDPSIHYPKDYNFVAKDKKAAKLHTIREDAKDRWKAGTKIDFFINCRQKDMFRFAPRIPVVSTQTIEIIADNFEFMNDYQIKIDGKLLSFDEQLELALNDGFDCLLHFFLYFNTDFTGKLIHWTDLKY